MSTSETPRFQLEVSDAQIQVEHEALVWCQKMQPFLFKADDICDAAGLLDSTRVDSNQQISEVIPINKMILAVLPSLTQTDSFMQLFQLDSNQDDIGEGLLDMLAYLRLVCLSKMDAFLLEAVFRKEVWGFMQEPVSMCTFNLPNYMSIYPQKCDAARDFVHE